MMESLGRTRRMQERGAPNRHRFMTERFEFKDTGYDKWRLKEAIQA